MQGREIADICIVLSKTLGAENTTEHPRKRFVTAGVVSVSARGTGIFISGDTERADSTGSGRLNSGVSFSFNSISKTMILLA